MPSGSLLEMRGVTRRYGHVSALADVNLQVRSGEAVAVLGRNGAGKTTLVRIAAGYLEPSDGTVLVNGRDRVSCRYAAE